MVGAIPALVAKLVNNLQTAKEIRKKSKRMAKKVSETSNVRCFSIPIDTCWKNKILCMFVVTL